MADSTDPYLNQLDYLISAGHIRGALEVLNAQARYRYTALYRLGDTHAENLVLVDREDAAAPLAERIFLGATYCSQVKALAVPVVATDTLLDERVVMHLTRTQVRAYCGVPLHESGGTIYGTLCQYDVIPVAASEMTLALMMEVAHRLQASEVSAYRKEIDARIDRLSDMKTAIAEASVDRGNASATFDMYAEPILTEARRKLSMEDALEVEAHVSAIKTAMLEDGYTRGFVRAPTRLIT